jgi:hypothetical protein
MDVVVQLGSGLAHHLVVASRQLVIGSRLIDLGAYLFDHVGLAVLGLRRSLVAQGLEDEP